MCGLIALLATEGTLDESEARAALDMVAHRGPDDDGVVAFRGSALDPVASASGHGRGDVRVILGHRRLAIIDLTPAGHQPMQTPGGECWIVYNGEVYNHVEIREELQRRGYTFVSRSDTEVILAAYREWGSRCLERFDGMFAFVLLDRVRRRLFAARDRFGIKPLYYWRSPDGVVAFASEIKQLTALSGWRARANGQRVYDFLNWGLCDHSDETLFEHVFQLRAGDLVEVGLDECKMAEHARLPVRRWYRPEARVFSGTLAEAAAQFRRLLSDSVEAHLRADVPVGSCLSGGLDSSSIVCLINRILRERGVVSMQRAFSARAEHTRYDEGPYIEAVVRHTGIEAHSVYPSLDELFGALDTITWHQDEPFGSTSIYAQWHVFRLAASRGAKVMLDGQGADEQLGGYHGFFSARFGGLARAMRWGTLLREMRAAARLHRYSNAWSWMQLANNLLPDLLRDAARRALGRSSVRPKWLDMERLGAVPRDPYLDAGAARSAGVRDLSIAQLVQTSLPMLLHWEDRNSMAHSVEARVPFLDHRLVEFVLGLPDEYKVCDGITKRVLREAMRGILPEAVRTRTDKLGFVTPEEIWMRESRPDRFRRALFETVEMSAGILRPAAVGLLERIIAGKQRFSFLIWRLISFGSWMKVFKVRV